MTSAITMSDDDNTSSHDGVPRVLPVVDESNRFFWEAGAAGHLKFLRCEACGLYLQPPGPVCRRCRSTDIAPSSVSGLATVMSFTVNLHPWKGAASEPYVIAIVNLDEQEDLNLTTNIVGCPIDDVHIGMRVAVTFEEMDGRWLPFFRPVEGDS